MTVTAVVGATWGDEGKGKITDALAADAQVVVRYQGGRNAGHTIINDRGRFALHLLPSGVFRPDVINLLGAGVALDLPALFAELDGLDAAGVPAPDLRVDARAQVVLPVHVRHDELEENRLGAAAFGSTRAGMAPFYADKAAKTGLQVGDLLDLARARQRLEGVLAARRCLFPALYGASVPDVDGLLADLAPFVERVRPLLCDGVDLLHRYLADGSGVLLEGQLGALRDLDHGIHPWTTSTSTLAGFAAVGAGLPPWAITDVVAVVKAYSSCVGAGPFVSEWHGAAGDELRRHGGDRGEYGATTGRPRRVGAFDAVAAHRGCRLQGATRAALTNLDVLGYLPEIPLCTAYLIDGERVIDLPPTRRLERASPALEHLPGWNSDLSAIRSWGDLPDAARRYVDRVEELIDTPVRLLSVGPARDALIHRDQ